MCHACPNIRQTLRHFIFSCPVAQIVWQEFRHVFALNTPVTLEQAAFSWPLNTQHLGRRFGHQLQAGHAVALYVIWTTHTQAVFQNQPARANTIRNRFRHHLLRHLHTQHATDIKNGHTTRFWSLWSQIVRSQDIMSPFPLSLRN